MASSVHELRLKAGESEKITINLGYVDLGSCRSDGAAGLLFEPHRFHPHRYSQPALAFPQCARAGQHRGRCHGRSRFGGSNAVARAVLTVLSAAAQRVCSSNTLPETFPQKPARRLTRQLFSEMKDLEMNNPLARDMIEATRLTQAGRLNEATALLQKLLRGDRFPSTESQGRDTARAAFELPAPTIDVVAEIKDIADVEAFSVKEPPSGTDGIQKHAGLHLAGPLRDVFDRFNLRGSAQALRGLLKRSPPLPSDIAPAGGQFIAKSFSNEAGSRAYKLYIPSHYRVEPRPLIVMLHGCTQSADDFAAGTRMNFGAEEHTCFVVYPEQAVAANSSKCWNWFKSGDQKRGRGEPSLIAGITRKVMTDYKIDPRRIYISPDCLRVERRRLSWGKPTPISTRRLGFIRD